MTKVAIQGVCGSYSNEAVEVMFGKDVGQLECVDFAETFDAVISERADYALVPLRNKIVGEIDSAVREFQKTKLKILDQLMIEVNHLLIGTPDAEFEN